MNEELEPRPAHLRDEPSTRTVEDFARDVDTLEKHFRLHSTPPSTSPEPILATPEDKPLTGKALDDAIKNEYARLDMEELDAQNEELRIKLLERNKQSNKGYQEAVALQNKVNASSPQGDRNHPNTQKQKPADTPPIDMRDKFDKRFNIPADWKLEPMDETVGMQDEFDKRFNIPATWKLEPMDKPPVAPDTVVDDFSSPKMPGDIDTPMPEVVTPAPALAPDAVVPETPVALKGIERPVVTIPSFNLSDDVVNTFATNFSLDAKTLADTPGFANLSEPQQRLVLERFSSLVREDIHSKAVKGHLEDIATLERTPASTRFGRLKRATRKGWTNATRSYRIGAKEAKLHEAWSKKTGASTQENRALLAQLSDSILKEHAFGIDKKGFVDFSGGNDSLQSISEGLNKLMREGPKIGEKGARDRLARLNEIIEQGVKAYSAVSPEKIGDAADWALRARREVVLGTFMEKNRDLEKNLQGDERARGFIRTAAFERGGIAVAGMVGRGILGTMGSFIAAPLVGAGIGGFLGWKRKGIEQSDTDLLARMGEKMPSARTTPEKSALTIAHLSTLRNEVGKRLADAIAAKKVGKTDKDADINVLSRRLSEYNTRIAGLSATPSSTPSATPSTSEQFSFDNSAALSEKLQRLSEEYKQAADIFESLTNPKDGETPDTDLIEQARKDMEKLGDRLTARIDYTQRRLLQKRVILDTVPTKREQAHTSLLHTQALTILAAQSDDLSPEQREASRKAIESFAQQLKDTGPEAYRTYSESEIADFTEKRVAALSWSKRTDITDAERAFATAHVKEISQKILRARAPRMQEKSPLEKIITDYLTSIDPNTKNEALSKELIQRLEANTLSVADAATYQNLKDKNAEARVRLEKDGATVGERQTAYRDMQTFAAEISRIEKKFTPVYSGEPASPSSRALALENIAMTLGTAETNLRLGDPHVRAEMEKRLNRIQGALVKGDTQVDKNRTKAKRDALVAGAITGASFGFAGAVIADVLGVGSARGATSTFTPEPQVPEQDTAGMDAFMAKLAAPSSSEQDTAGLDALMAKLAAPEVPAPVAPVVPETVVGGSGGKQISIEDWRKPVGHGSTAERLAAMQAALAPEPRPPVEYTRPRIGTPDYHSPQSSRYFPESGRSGMEAITTQREIPKVLLAPSLPVSPEFIEYVAQIPHETPADATRVMDFYTMMSEGKSASFSQHLREAYTQKAYIAMKYPELTEQIAHMNPPTTPETLQALVTMTKGAHLHGMSNPFMYASRGISDAEVPSFHTERLATYLRDMNVTFTKDTAGNITGYRASTRGITHR